MSKSSGQIVCGLTNWAKNESGRGRKSDRQSRWVFIRADKQNWALAIEREGSPPIGQKFAAQVGQTLTNSAMLTGRPIGDIVNNVAKALSETLEVPYSTENKSPNEVMDELDKIFQTDLLAENPNPKLEILLGTMPLDEDEGA